MENNSTTGENKFLCIRCKDPQKKHRSKGFCNYCYSWIRAKKKQIKQTIKRIEIVKDKLVIFTEEFLEFEGKI